MARNLEIIRKRSTFILVRNRGTESKGITMNVQSFQDTNLKNSIYVGFTATKKLGTAVKRNKAKRIMRELARKVITKYGKINSYYVLIAKSSIFDIPFDLQENELKKLIS